MVKEPACWWHMLLPLYSCTYYWTNIKVPLKLKILVCEFFSVVFLLKWIFYVKASMSFKMFSAAASSPQWQHRTPSQTKPCCRWHLRHQLWFLLMTSRWQMSHIIKAITPLCCPITYLQWGWFDSWKAIGLMNVMNNTNEIHCMRRTNWCSLTCHCHSRPVQSHWT